MGSTTRHTASTHSLRPGHWPLGMIPRFRASVCTHFKGFGRILYLLINVRTLCRIRISNFTFAKKGQHLSSFSGVGLPFLRRANSSRGLFNLAHRRHQSISHSVNNTFILHLQCLWVRARHSDEVGVVSASWSLCCGREASTA